MATENTTTSVNSSTTIIIQEANVGKKSTMRSMVTSSVSMVVSLLSTCLSVSWIWLIRQQSLRIITTFWQLVSPNVGLQQSIFQLGLIREFRLRMAPVV